MEALIKNFNNEEFAIELGHVAEAVGLDSEDTQEYKAIVSERGIETAFEWLNSFMEGSIELI